MKLLTPEEEETIENIKAEIERWREIRRNSIFGSSEGGEASDKILELSNQIEPLLAIRETETELLGQANQVLEAFHIIWPRIKPQIYGAVPALVIELEEAADAIKPVFEFAAVEEAKLQYRRLKAMMDQGFTRSEALELISQPSPLQQQLVNYQKKK